MQPGNHPLGAVSGPAAAVEPAAAGLGPQAALESLAAALDPRDYATTLTTGPGRTLLVRD